MSPETFTEILDQRLSKIYRVLGQKAEEYAFEGDRLHNFKLAARINGESPEEALWGMATKHLVSVFDLIEGRLERTPEKIDEKVGDMINYLILLEAILKEED